MHSYSLAYLTAPTLTAPQAVAAAALLGYQHVGLRLFPSTPEGPCQDLLGNPLRLRETVARLADTGVGVWDLEVIRIGAQFDARACVPLLDAGAALKARAVLVMAEDPDEARLAQSYAQVCALAAPYGMTADLEFIPWTTVPDARAAWRVVRLAGQPANAGVLVDALHVSRSRTTPQDIAALPRALLHYAQICDAPVGGPYTVQALIHTARQERLLPGEGAIDLKGLFAALPVDLPVSIEIPHHVRMPTLGAVEWARQALAASRAVLQRS